MKVKRLEPDSWMLDIVDPDGFFDAEDMPKECVEIEPVIGRVGWYLHGDSCWFEVGDVAYTYDAEMFRFVLDMFHASELRPEEVNGLRAIHRTRFATNEQKQAYWSRLHWLEYREVYREARKSFLTL